MIIEFENRIYKLPAPQSQHDELVITVEMYDVIRSPDSAKDSRFNFTNALSKFFFFLLHEGPRLTVNKVLATLLYRKIINERKLVIAYGFCESDQGKYVCIGPQDSPGAGQQVFLGKCCVPADSDQDYAVIKKSVTTFLTRHPHLHERLFHYSGYSGTDLDFSLDGVLDTPSADNINQHFYKPGILAREASGRRVLQPKTGTRPADNSLFIAGAGAYVYAYVLPYIKGVTKHTIIDLNPVLAARIGYKHDFLHWETSCSAALTRLSDCHKPILIVATYHSTHYEILDDALARNPETRVFIEKPPVTTTQQLEQLILKRQEGSDVEIGFNRRYSRMIRTAKKLLAGKSGPVAMTCIVKELKLPLTHWYYWPDQGTRITGNLCHWIDLGTYFIGAAPVTACIGAAAKSSPGDELSIVICYEDGSRLTLMSTDCGNSLRGVQEYIDIRQADTTITIEDFLCMKVLQNGKSRCHRSLIRDKGHKNMYREFMKRISTGMPSGYSNRDLHITGMLYLNIVNAARNGDTDVDLGELANSSRLTLDTG